MPVHKFHYIPVACQCCRYESASSRLWTVSYNCEMLPRWWAGSYWFPLGYVWLQGSLTFLSLLSHICVRVINVVDSGLLLIWYHAIIWTCADLSLLIYHKIKLYGNLQSKLHVISHSLTIICSAVLGKLSVMINIDQCVSNSNHSMFVSHHVLIIHWHYKEELSG